MIAKLEKVSVIEKQLCQHEIGPLVDLCLEPLPIDVFAFFARDVAFRKTSDANTKAVQFFEKPNQFVGKLKPTFNFAEDAIRAAFRIAAQC